jgi:RNA polymerase primary sigma factor
MLRKQEHDRPLGALEQYRSEVKWIPRVTNEEEARLLQCIKHAKEDSSKECSEEQQQARIRLIEGYLPLVLGIAKRYEHTCREMELLDLAQEGNLGLLQALEKYDASKSGSSFGTWAYSWIRGMIRCALLREGVIRLPMRKARAMRQMSMVNTQLFSRLGREPTIEETAKEMRTTPRELRELIVLQEQRVVSLHMACAGDEELSLAEMIADPSADGFSSIEDVLEQLNERERAVMKLRYGVDDGQPRTQREVAELLGMNLSTVQMLDGRARMRLRRALVA